MKIGSGFFDKVINTGTDVVDFATSIPKKLDDLENKTNDFLIELGQKFKKGRADAEDIATENLASNKVRTLGSRFATWVQKPVNLAITAGALIAVIVLIRKA